MKRAKHFKMTRSETATSLLSDPDTERPAKLDAERVTLQFAQRSSRRFDAGRESIEDSPLFGGPRQITLDIFTEPTEEK